MIELSTGYPGGLDAAAAEVVRLLKGLGQTTVTPVKGYVATELLAGDVVVLVQRDRPDTGPGAAGGAQRGAIYRSGRTSAPPR